MKPLPRVRPSPRSLDRDLERGVEERIGDRVICLDTDFVQLKIRSDAAGHLALGIGDLHAIRALEHGKFHPARPSCLGLSNREGAIIIRGAPAYLESQIVYAIASRINHVGKDVMLALVLAGRELTDASDDVVRVRRGCSGRGRC